MYDAMKHMIGTNKYFEMSFFLNSIETRHGNKKGRTLVAIHGNQESNLQKILFQPFEFQFILLLGAKSSNLISLYALGCGGYKDCKARTGANMQSICPNLACLTCNFVYPITKHGKWPHGDKVYYTNNTRIKIHGHHMKHKARCVSSRFYYQYSFQLWISFHSEIG